MEKRILKVGLDTNAENNTLRQHILQGSQDTILQITVTQDGRTQTPKSTADVTVFVVYPDETKHMIDSTDSEFATTIDANGVISIPITESISRASGNNTLIVMIEDQDSNSNDVISYSYRMNFTIDTNMAYTGQSTIDNLPTYRQVQQEINNIEGDIKDLETDKLNKDFSNVNKVDFESALTKSGVQLGITPQRLGQEINSLRGKDRVDYKDLQNAPDLTAKLDTDLGNVDSTGLKEKLNDLKVPFSGADIRDLLTSLKQNDRLDASSIKNLPTSTSSDNAVTQVALVDDKLQITHGDGSKHVIALPKADTTELATKLKSYEQSLTQQGVDIAGLRQQYGVLNTKVTSLNNVFYYNGSLLPILSSLTNSAYFIRVRGLKSSLSKVPMPAPKDGVIFHLTNDDKSMAIDLIPAKGDTINNSVSLEVRANSHVTLIGQGNDWSLVSEGNSFNQETPISINDIKSAVNHGFAPDDARIKALDDGFWIIKDLKSVNGRPDDSKGDLQIFKNTIFGSGSKKYAFMMGVGLDSSGRDTIWVSYRDGSDWSNWFKDKGTSDLSSVNKDIANLKLGQQGALTKLSKVETDLGNIFAPTQLIFDKEVNKLVDAKIANIKPKQGDTPKLPSGIPRIYSEYGVDFPKTIGVSGQVSSVSGILHLTRTDTSSKRIFVLVPNDNNQAEDVSGISVDGGLKALWQARILTINGKDYKAFYSFGGYTDRQNVIRVYFGSQG